MLIYILFFLLVFQQLVSLHDSEWHIVIVQFQKIHFRVACFILTIPPLLSYTTNVLHPPATVPSGPCLPQCASPAVPRSHPYIRWRSPLDWSGEPGWGWPWDVGSATEGEGQTEPWFGANCIWGTLTTKRLLLCSCLVDLHWTILSRHWFKEQETEKVKWILNHDYTTPGKNDQTINAKMTNLFCVIPKYSDVVKPIQNIKNIATLQTSSD